MVVSKGDKELCKAVIRVVPVAGPAEQWAWRQLLNRCCTDPTSERAQYLSLLDMLSVAPGCLAQGISICLLPRLIVNLRLRS